MLALIITFIIGMACGAGAAVVTLWLLADDLDTFYDEMAEAEERGLP